MLANDRSQAELIVPLLDDRAPIVRHASALALLNAPDIAIARQALRQLLETRSAALPHAEFDFDRLCSARVADLVLDRFEDVLSGARDLRFYYRFVDSLPHELLKTRADRLVKLVPDDRDEPYRDTLLHAMIRSESEIVVSFLARELHERLANGEEWPIRRYLKWCAERGRPFPFAVSFLEDVLDGNVLPYGYTSDQASAAVTLVRWGIPGAMEKLLEFLSFSRYVGKELALLPPSALLVLLRSGINEPQTLGSDVSELLRLKSKREIRPYTRELQALWKALKRSKTSRVDLVWGLATADLPELDQLLTEELAANNDDEVVRTTLAALLQRRTAMGTTDAVEALGGIAKLRHPTASKDLWPDKHWNHPSLANDEIVESNSALVAHLLLAWWDAPGAKSRLTAMLLEHNYLFHPLLNDHTPPSMTPRFQRIAAENPAYALRVEWLLADKKERRRISRDLRHGKREW